MTSPQGWSDIASIARTVEAHDFSGLVFTETSEVPWMKITAAAIAAPRLDLATGIAVAFPRSPMVSAAAAWEIAGNTQGRFRLGLGSQVKGHVVRRYSSDFTPAANRLRDYVDAVKACFRAFAGDEPLAHDGPFYQLSYLPAAWSPPRHTHHDIKVDISAVGPIMTRVAGEVADGVHVHPLHSMNYITARLLPGLADGANRTGRDPSDIDLIIPVFAVPGDNPEERQPLLDIARRQIGFYGSTPNYAFQFDDLGFEGTTKRLGGQLRTGDFAGMEATVTDEMLEHFAVVGPWDEMADRLIARYGGTAARLVMYLAEDSIRSNSKNTGRWGEIARSVRAVE
jgi:probable F420-dependent oxidoreductase